MSAIVLTQVIRDSPLILPDSNRNYLLRIRVGLLGLLKVQGVNIFIGPESIWQVALRVIENQDVRDHCPGRNPSLRRCFEPLNTSSRRQILGTRIHSGRRNHRIRQIYNLLVARSPDHLNLHPSDLGRNVVRHVPHRILVPPQVWRTQSRSGQQKRELRLKEPVLRTAPP